MRIKLHLHFHLAGFVLFALLATLMFPWLAARRADAQDDWQTRVVRLSFVEGTVGVLPADSSEWAEAPINTPIERGYELATQKDSFAEVEFENASTIRLGELSDVRFDRLDFSDSGRRISRVRFENGYGTIHVFSGSSEDFQVEAGGAVLSPEGECEFRIDRDDQSLRVEVWSGGINFAGPLGNVELFQNQALTYAPDSGEPYDIESGLTQDDWDRWVARRDQIETSPSPSITPNSYGGVASNNLYGWSDLSNYGEWAYYSNVGYSWFPFASTVWTPYSFGRWVWYPGFGYTWVSSEPWGWLPYHYGQWAYEPGAGWAWTPSSFANWSPALVNWYQGPGWIGWTPQAPGASLGSGIPCPSLVRGCLVALSARQFQQGTFVTPRGSLRVDPQQGERVGKPDLPATPFAMLPGPPLANPSAIRGIPAGSMSAAADRQRTHFAPRAIVGRRPSAVPQSHFTRARAPRSSPLPASQTGGGFGGMVVVPVRPGASPHPASRPAPVAPRGGAPH